MTKQEIENFNNMAEIVCDKLCKYPLIWDEEKLGPLASSDICANCPLVLFEVDGYSRRNLIGGET